MLSLQDEIDELGPWFHNIHLPDGTQTAPGHELGDFPLFKWREISSSVPQDLSGWNVLDVGCNAGFYSFELAKRGAHVTAIDMDPRYLAQASWALRKFGLENRVSLKLMQLYDLARIGSRFDLVWFMGVFYHLRYPMLGLDILSRRTGRLMMFQTLTLQAEERYEDLSDIPLQERDVMNQPGWPKMAFIEHSLARDPTNWWAPTHTAVIAMLRAAGFRVLARPSDEVYLCERGDMYIDPDDLREREYRSATGIDAGPPAGEPSGDVASFDVFRYAE